MKYSSAMQSLQDIKLGMSIPCLRGEKCHYGWQASVSDKNGHKNR
jgi:hypothetical protein